MMSSTKSNVHEGTPPTLEEDRATAIGNMH